MQYTFVLVGLLWFIYSIFRYFSFFNVIKEKSWQNLNLHCHQLIINSCIVFFLDCDDPIQFIGENGETCLGFFPVFTWSSAENKCLRGYYTGCKGSKNKFYALEDCENIAKPVCEKW